jgi:hypothetical protein
MSAPTITWDDLFTSHMSTEALQSVDDVPESAPAELT